MRTATVDKRFSPDDVLLKYSEVYKLLPSAKKEKYAYENIEWYRLYSKHRDAPMIMMSNRDFLLCRDIYFATVITVPIYMLLTLVLRLVAFDWRYIAYLAVMLILSNLGARNKAMRHAYNVIAYDMNTPNKTKENDHG